MNTLKILFNTSRPVSWVNTAYPFVVGYLMMGGAVDIRLIVGGIFFLIPYNLLMYGINDVFDYESDIRNPRKGGIEGAITPKEFHRPIILTSVVSSVPFVLYLLFTGTLVSAVVLLAVLFFVVAYSAKGLRFKERPFLDSVSSSIHFVGPLLFAFALVGSNTVGWLVAIAFFFWGIASQAFGAIQDIIPDRKASIHSIATVLGARRTLWFVGSMYLAAVVTTALVGGVALIVALAGFAYVANILPYFTITDKRSGDARAGWRRFLWINYGVGAVVTMCCLLSVMSV